MPTELRHADNREFAALSGEVFSGGGRTRRRRIVHQYPVRRQDPDVVAADAAIQETVSDTGRRTGLTGSRRQVSDAYSMNLMVEARNRQYSEAWLRTTFRHGA